MTTDYEEMVERGATASLGHHCTTCGGSVNDSGRCRSCGGIACRADKTDPVAPDPPCYGCKVRAERVLTAAGVPELLAENERLRRIELAVQRACTHDWKCEEEGEGDCCFRAWRAVALAAWCAVPITEEDDDLLASLEREAQS